jgi:hypothetical protein
MPEQETITGRGRVLWNVTKSLDGFNHGTRRRDGLALPLSGVDRCRP